MPPSRGGFGANVGIEDAHNLAWKLAAGLNGESRPSLLDTYDAERRPVVLAGEVDRSGEATRSVLDSGMDMESVRSVLDGMTQGQSVMLATNEIMATCALAFCVAAALIWLAPRAGRVVDMSKVGH